MTKGTRKTDPHSDTAREDRLKAALKANLGRRKAQARARATPAVPEDGGQPPARQMSQKVQAGGQGNQPGEVQAETAAKRPDTQA